MKYYFIPKIEINVIFSDKEFEILNEAIRNSEYKFFAIDENGWWFKIAKIRSNFLDVPIEITFRNLDKLLKCLEPYVNYTHMKSIESMSAYNRIRRILTDCNTHAKMIQPLFEQDLKEI